MALVNVEEYEKGVMCVSRARVDAVTGGAIGQLTNDAILICSLFPASACEMQTFMSTPSDPSHIKELKADCS